MSLQLHLYPQDHNGQYTYDNYVNTTNLVSDSTFWWASYLMGSTAVTSSTPSETAMIAAVPAYAWKSYYTNGGSFDATAAASTGSSPNNLTLTSTGTGKSGVYQLVDNLIVGLQYDITIEVNTAAVGTISCRNFGGASVVTGGILYDVIGGNGYTLSQSFVNTNPITSTFTFTATGTEQILCVNWESAGNTTINIKKVIIKQSPSTPVITNIDDGQEIVDMYSHENLPLTLSIDNFKNVAEKTQSYSKAFKLPATKHNNKIFNHLHEVTIATQGQSSVFNPYRISRAILKENGHTIFEGGLKLIDIQNIEGEISYNVNLFSSSISLKTAVGKKTFADFQNGFDELEHDYNKDNIKDSWIGKLPITFLGAGSFAGAVNDTETDVLKYPFCRWNGNITQDVGGSTNKYPRLTELSDAFRPWIRVKYLVDRIIAEAGFQYQSDFMEGIGNYAGTSTHHEPDFKRLFMDFNWGNDLHPANVQGTETIEYIRNNDASNNSAIGSHKRIIWNNNESNLNSQGWVNYDDEIVCANDNTIYDLVWNINIQTFGASEYQVNLWKDDGTSTLSQWSSFHTSTGNDVVMHSGTATILCDAGDKLYFTFKKQSGSVIQGINATPGTPTCDLTCGMMDAKIKTETLLTKRNKIKQWDFLKDLFTMFNLIVLKDKDNDTLLKIEPYDDIFIDNLATTNITQQTYDWTDKVDLSEIKLTPLKLKQEVFFNYKKDEKDYATGVYNSSTGYVFGNYEIDASSFSVSSGQQKLELKVFASTYCTPLFANFSSTLTVPQIITQKDDGTIEGIDNKPRILYDITGNQSAIADLPDLSWGTYYIPAGAGLVSENQSNVCLFGHVTEYPTTSDSRDFNFGAHQIISSMGNTPAKNLFTEYWSPYYDELYHSDTKTMKIKVLLTALEISKINFYDIIQIKNRQYRINKIDYKPNQLSNVELILLS